MRSVQKFFDMKARGERIAMLTAYDAPTARFQAQAGLDIILVGDSVGTNMLGYGSEKDVTIADIAHHTRAVRRGAPDMFVISDLPYRTCETPADAVKNSRVLIEAGGDMVKFEGTKPEIVRALKDAGIVVCGHIGLEPQHHEEKRLKGRTADEARALVASAKALDDAKIDMIVLEVIPEELGAAITKAVRAPTIGIGAGRGTDGQVLVVVDMIGLHDGTFKHNRRYATLGDTQREAYTAYVNDVHAGMFPGPENAFRMKADELKLFAAD